MLLYTHIKKMELIYTLKLYDKNVTFPMHGQILLLSLINLRILGGLVLKLLLDIFDVFLVF